MPSVMSYRYRPPCRWCERVSCMRPLPGGLYLCGWSGYRRRGDDRPCPWCWRDGFLISAEVVHRLGKWCVHRPGKPG
jgi:hypothetical protein